MVKNQKMNRGTQTQKMNRGTQSPVEPWSKRKMNKGTQSPGEPWCKVRRWTGVHSHRVNRGKESEDEQGYTVYGVSQIHKNTLSETEKYALDYTAIYNERATFLNISKKTSNSARCPLKLHLTLA